jgi:methylated-DNA-[protein]-cysteine S-methyltransferase
MVQQVAYEAEGWGVGELVVSGGRVVWHELPHAGPSATGERNEIVDLLQAYFAGEDVSLEDVPVDLEYESDFFTQCAEALRAVPRGEVVTYGELAALAGRPGAARAAGTFCARCDLSPFVPTHRVISSTGLGPYGELGAEYKRRLLELEGVQL